jgi:hypothetical protein
LWISDTDVDRIQDGQLAVIHDRGLEWDCCFRTSAAAAAVGLPHRVAQEQQTLGYGWSEKAAILTYIQRATVVEHQHRRQNGSFPITRSLVQHLYADHRQGASTLLLGNSSVVQDRALEQGHPVRLWAVEQLECGLVTGGCAAPMDGSLLPELILCRADTDKETAHE